jgi:hypothetical protein
MSGETNPILAGVIPAFEMFMTSWERLAEKHPRFRSWIDTGLDWASTYYSRMDLTKSYIITMGELAISHPLFALIRD